MDFAYQPPIFTVVYCSEFVLLSFTVVYCFDFILLLFTVYVNITVNDNSCHINHLVTGHTVRREQLHKITPGAYCRL